ncbi:alpha/beta fold hydrolase [Rhodohalobacter sp. SW132]|uniref:alpha/beta fold hydrolase n=1 Tax=Rhodohalobacter sp. SW132 TaxID=2293433 RepID=UPI001313F412|nr:alpha/beta hydrolase [Rhodohalobacter sp. SW132]
MAKVILWWITGICVILILWIFVAYLMSMNRAYERISGKSSVISSPFGNIEYMEGGNVSGDPVLVVHGAGGGFDQGELIAETVLDDQFRWIIPSRFGYLGSSLPENATWDDQADAYAYLLDHLEVEKAAVVAMSQGGPSALLFAVNYPERVSSLTCISCGVAASESEFQAGANKKGNALKVIFTYNFPYWAISKLFKKQFMGILGVDEEVVAGLTPGQFEMVEYFIDSMNPAAPRSTGAAFDNEATLPGGRIASIKAPTLIIHAKDDLLQLYHNAEFTASAIAGSMLMSYESGGHILMAVEQEAIRPAVYNHIIAPEESMNISIE